MLTEVIAAHLAALQSIFYMCQALLLVRAQVPAAVGPLQIRLERSDNACQHPEVLAHILQLCVVQRFDEVDEALDAVVCKGRKGQSSSRDADCFSHIAECAWMFRG